MFINAAPTSNDIDATVVAATRALGCQASSEA